MFAFPPPRQLRGGRRIDGSTHRCRGAPCGCM